MNQINWNAKRLLDGSVYGESWKLIFLFVALSFFQVQHNKKSLNIIPHLDFSQQLMIY